MCYAIVDVCMLSSYHTDTSLISLKSSLASPINAHSFEGSHGWFLSDCQPCQDVSNDNMTDKGDMVRLSLWLSVSDQKLEQAGTLPPFINM